MKLSKGGLLFSLASVVLSSLMVSCADQPQSQPQAKDEVRNVIFMIGDGMGLAQASMSMVENGYKPTVFDRAKGVALIKTYSANNRVTDSAAAGTALACGEKTDNKVVGLTAQRDTCYSMAKGAKAKGMATGVVVACAVQHATPAAFYAHTPDRDDAKTITHQLATNKYLDLVVGGGAKSFKLKVEDKTLADVAKSNGFNIVSNMDELKSAPDGKTLGLFAEGHIADYSQRGDFLPRATELALERLSKSEDGFFLMVEGSQIDWACHANDAEVCKGEMVDFCNTVEVAMKFADENPGTLIVITADHETGGLSMVSGDKDFKKSDSGLLYKFSTGSHSGILVPVYLYGTGAEQISGVMENTELSKKISKAMGL